MIIHTWRIHRHCGFNLTSSLSGTSFAIHSVTHHDLLHRGAIVHLELEYLLSSNDGPDPRQF